MDLFGINRMASIVDGSAAKVEERQNVQWQFADGALTAASAHLAAEDYQAAIATALTGLLALKLSDS